MSTILAIIAIAAVLWAAVVVFALALFRSAAHGDAIARACPPARPRRRGGQG